MNQEGLWIHRLKLRKVYLTVVLLNFPQFLGSNFLEWPKDNHRHHLIVKQFLCVRLCICVCVCACVCVCVCV
jgi:hypothetical protein